MVSLYVGLGTNLGDRRAHLRAAVTALRAHFPLLGCSRLYETAPLYVTDQPSFYNMAVALQSDQPPLDLLDLLKQLEQQIGRTETFRYGPRVIDLDILLYGDQVVDHPRLTVPHPRLPERHFALAPLADLAPNVLHPLLGRTMAQLLADLPPADDQIRALPDGL